MRIFSYLPNPRVWKSLIAAEYSGATIEVIGDKPPELPNWLWDFEARKLAEEEKDPNSPMARTGKRGFGSTLYKTDEFLRAHPFGTVPAAFSDDGQVGVFDSNSILRAAARSGPNGNDIYPQDDPWLASRIDSFLDAALVFGREFQVYLLGIDEMSEELYERMTAAYEFYLSGIEQALNQTSNIACDFLTIADIGFACDLGQFLRERKMIERLDSFPHAPITARIANDYPKSYQHLKDLAVQPYFKPYLERVIKDLP